MPGYMSKFVHPLLKRHECPICHRAMRNPMQTECGHMFCKDCLEPILNERCPICPLDQKKISLEKVFPNSKCRNEILNLDVFCRYMDIGCSWRGKLKDEATHSSKCVPISDCCWICCCTLPTQIRHSLRPQTCDGCVRFKCSYRESVDYQDQHISEQYQGSFVHDSHEQLVIGRVSPVTTKSLSNKAELVIGILKNTVIDVIKTKMEFLRKTIELTNSELNAAHATGTAVLNLATNGMATNHLEKPGTQKTDPRAYNVPI